MTEIWTDEELKNLDHLIKMVEAENRRQLEKWGTQTHQSYQWLCFLMEEVGEVAEAIAEADYREGDLNNIARELIQVATLALKMAEMSVQIRTLKP